MNRRQFISVAGAAAALLALGEFPVLAAEKPTDWCAGLDGIDWTDCQKAYARVLRPGGKWVAIHRRPTGPVLAVVRCYAAAPVA